MTRGADRKDLLLYLETFAHTVGVMQTPGALTRVARECAEDLAADGVVYAEVRYAPEQHLSAGSASTRSSTPSGRVPGRRGRTGIRIGTLLTRCARGLARWRSRDLAVRWRDRGVVGFDIAGAEAGYSRRATSTPSNTSAARGCHLTLHAGEAFGLPSIWEALQLCGAERLGHGVRIVDDIEAGPGDEVRLGRVAHLVRDRRVPLELCPTSNVHSGAAPSIEEHPIGLPMAAVPRHRQHRQPADVGDVALSGVPPARRGVRDRVGPDRTAHDERDEVGIHPVRRAARPAGARHLASLRGAAERVTKDTPAIREVAASGVPFRVVRTERPTSAEESAALQGIEVAQLIRTIVVRRGAGAYVFVLVPGGRQIEWPLLRAHLGVSRLSLPDKEEAKEATGYERGTITPFASATTWPVVRRRDTDARAPRGDRRRCPRRATSTSTADLIRLLDADVADVTRPGS